MKKVIIAMFSLQELFCVHAELFAVRIYVFSVFVCFVISFHRGRIVSCTMYAIRIDD